MEILDGGEYDQALIFCRTQGRVDMVSERLSRRGFAIQGIHGGMVQKQRDAAMNAFRDGSLKLLVATNVAARGLDIAAVSNVINFDIPETVEEYLHRIGRTARMGRPGTAVTFVAEWDLEFFQAIKKHVGEANLERLELSLYRAQAPGPASATGSA
jgi:superfamily II DNA/RNA helicase